MSKKTKLSFVVGSTLLISIVMLYAFRMEIGSRLLARGFQVSPEDNFNYEFSTPIEQIEGLRGGGSTWMDHHDTYIRFRCERVVELKGIESYRQAGVEAAPMVFFKEKFPRDSDSLEDPENIVVYSKTISPGKMKKCLVHNTRTQTYFFRVWN